MPSFSGFLGHSWAVKFHKVKLLKLITFKFNLKFLWNWSFFHYERIMRFKKVFTNLETERQGRGIIMRVTRLLLLGPYHSIQTNFLYFFAHDCTSTWFILEHGNFKFENNRQSTMVNLNSSKKINLINTSPTQF